jgi:uncharacterized protein
MQKGTLTGGAIAFFTFAVMLLAVPLDKYLIAKMPLSPELVAVLSKSLSMLALGTLLSIFWLLRKEVIRTFFAPIPRNRRLEVVAVAVLKLLQPFALFGAMALWFSFTEGAISLENRVHVWRDPSGEAKAFAVTGFAGLLLGAIAAPFIEEIIFRGLLFSAWKERWGWFGSMLLTSAVFAFYHQILASAFIGSMIYVCLFRRTGTLLAPILVHAAFNASAWHPFLGQFYFPSQTPGDLSSWWFHLTCLLILVIAIPAYLVMAHRGTAEESQFNARLVQS